MKSVLISIRPQWCEKITSGKKTIEVRKSAPKEVPFKAYIYCTKAEPFIQKIRFGDIAISHTQISKNLYNGKVIGEFICDKVIRTCGWRLRGETQRCAKRTAAEEEFPRLACLTIDEIVEYSGSENLEVAGWHISDLKIYDIPKTLSEFHKYGAESLENLFDTDSLCQYCSQVDYGEHKYYISSRWGMVSCEGRWCDEAYKEYLDVNFALTRPPMSWQYVEELK